MKRVWAQTLAQLVGRAAVFMASVIKGWGAVARGRLNRGLRRAAQRTPRIESCARYREIGPCAHATKAFLRFDRSSRSRMISRIETTPTKAKSVMDWFSDHPQPYEDSHRRTAHGHTRITTIRTHGTNDPDAPSYVLVIPG